MATIYFNQGSLFVQEDYEKICQMIEKATDLNSSFIQLSRRQVFCDTSNRIVDEKKSIVLIKITSINYIES